ncbi:hypothetical protein [Fodinicola feengrottensis]|uniref:hypothetical protein n=1 Tax=Fodinicola feengrottensis TaxID=435914 RepID=UPI002442B23C|nr:hypothetical protein [Fodinicola feengrottensis]
MLGGFLDVLAKLRLGVIDPADVEAVRGKRLETFNHPDADAHALPSYAANLLTGQPNGTASEIHAVTTQDVHEVAVEAASAALLQVPARRSADWAGFAPAPMWSGGTVTGQRLPSWEDSQTALIIGDQGVSLDTPNGTVTVLYNECAAMLSRPDGGRRLVGLDGMSVNLEPTLFYPDVRAWAYLDSRVPPQVVVPLPARAAQDVPRPEPQGTPVPGVTSPTAYPTGPASPARPPEKKPSVLEKITLVILAVVTAVLVCAGGLSTLGVASGDGGPTDAGVWFVVGAVWCLAAIVALPLIVLARRAFRRNGP